MATTPIILATPEGWCVWGGVIRNAVTYGGWLGRRKVCCLLDDEPVLRVHVLRHRRLVSKRSANGQQAVSKLAANGQQMTGMTRTVSMKRQAAPHATAHSARSCFFFLVCFVWLGSTPPGFRATTRVAAAAQTDQPPGRARHAQGWRLRWQTDLTPRAELG